MEILYPTPSQIFRCEWIGIGLLRNLAESPYDTCGSPYDTYGRDKTWRCFVYLVDGIRKSGGYWKTYKENSFAVRFAIGPTIMTPSFHSLVEDMKSRNTHAELYSTRSDDLLIITNYSEKSTQQLMENVLPKFLWGWKI